MPSKRDLEEKAAAIPESQYHANEQDRQNWRERMLTDQRFANLMEMADVIGDLPADGITFLRLLGDPKRESLLTFFAKAKPETLDWLADLRPEEVVGLKAYLVLRSAGSYLAWACGAVIGGVAIIAGIANIFFGWKK